MYNFYLPPPSYIYLKEKFPNMNWLKLDVNMAIKLNNFLHDNCQYMLIFMDSNYRDYIPIIVTKEIDDDIIIMCEFMYNPKTNMAEIYNIGTNIVYRQRGHAKGLNTVFTDLQHMLECDLWIAVALNNPMYKVASDIYLNMGFIDDVKISYKTPTGVLYPPGFMEMKRHYEILKKEDSTPPIED
jgi:hypothetical protein